MPVSIPLNHPVNQLLSCNLQVLKSRAQKMKRLDIRTGLYNKRGQTNAALDEEIAAVRGSGGDTTRLEYEKLWVSITFQKEIVPFNSPPIDIYEAGLYSLDDFLKLALIALKAQSATLVDVVKRLFERLLELSDYQFLAIVDPPTPLGVSITSTPILPGAPSPLAV